jgi:hypothetical protein
MQNSYAAAIRKIMQLWRGDGRKRTLFSAHGLPERIPKNDTHLQNADGDQIRAEAEFNMMENINLLIIEHCNLACAHCSQLQRPLLEKYITLQSHSANG